MSRIEVQWVEPQHFGTPAGVTPPDTVIYAMGDVHGTCDLLEAMQQRVELDLGQRRKKRAVIVYHGDYIGRGNFSKQSVERVRSWRPTGCDDVTVIPLKGNHEDMALRYLDHDLELGRHWLESGGLTTLASYGVRPDDPHARDDEDVEDLRRRFAEALPPEHLGFLLGLRPCHREGGYHFVHAGVRPGVPLDRQTVFDQMWVKYLFLGSEEDFGATVVHGHTIMRAPQLHANRIAIDTGAYKSGNLTCAVLDGESRRFLQTARV